MNTKTPENEYKMREINANYKLSDYEKDALGEIGNMSMGACATTLSTLLGKRVTITTPMVSLCKRDNVLNEYEKPIVIAEVAYIKGVEGNNIFILKKEDALLITDLLMGNDGTSPEEELKEYYLSATSEVMNQMVGSSATALSDILQTDINISPPIVNEVSREDNFSGVSFEDETYIRVSFRMEIEGLIVSNIMNLMSYEFGKGLVRLLTCEEEETNTQVQTQAVNNIAKAETVNPKIHKQESIPVTDNEKKIDLKAVKYQSFNSSDHLPEYEYAHKNINLLLDVPLQVTVVLGKSKKSIEEILKLNVGSIVVLDRLAGEMVDVHVNGKLFAHGEVVVIDDNYGVRITELTEPDSMEDYELRRGRQVLMDMVGGR